MKEAAGAFANLRDVASLRVEQPRPVDISPECASMLERLCLAQGQECIFEKARADSKSPAILARLSLQWQLGMHLYNACCSEAIPMSAASVVQQHVVSRLCNKLCRGWQI